MNATRGRRNPWWMSLTQTRRLLWLLAILLCAGSQAQAEPPTTPPTTAKRATDITHLAHAARNLSWQVLVSLNRARRAGSRRQAACLDRTLSEINALRRTLHGPARESRRANLTHRLANLRDRAQTCLARRTHTSGTRVDAVVPSEPEGEPLW